MHKPSETPLLPEQKAPQEPHQERDRHLFGPGPKRILALDGGGVRGAISVAFLERIEAIFTEHQRRQAALAQAGGGPPIELKPVRLADHFDLIGGTSTGAVIAGALALGKQVADIKDFYLRLAPEVFKKSHLRIPHLQAKFDARPLREKIKEIVKEETLDSEALVTGFCLIAKRMDTGSPWILSNNKLAPYWDAVPGQQHLANKDYKLANLVRASTAAPHFFDPEVIPITKAAQREPTNGARAAVIAHPWLSFLVSKIRAIRALKDGRDPDTHGLFVDGGVTPYNNPALALLMLAVLKPYRLTWPLGVDQLSIVSIGTGSHRTRLTFKELGVAGPLRVAIKSMKSMMGDNGKQTLALMQWLGECPDPWSINSEIGTLAQEMPPGHRWFRFQRYDMPLEQPYLKNVLGLSVSGKELERYHEMTNPKTIAVLYDLACMVAKDQVKYEHFFPTPKPTAPNMAPQPPGDLAQALPSPT